MYTLIKISRWTATFYRFVVENYCPGELVVSKCVSVCDDCRLSAGFYARRKRASEREGLRGIVV